VIGGGACVGMEVFLGMWGGAGRRWWSGNGGGGNANEFGRNGDDRWIGRQIGLAFRVHFDLSKQWRVCSIE